MVSCFVTGGSGFVGSHIVRLLKEKRHEVTVLVRSSSSLELIDELTVSKAIGDVTDPTTLQIAVPEDTEWFFHNAAIMADWGGKSHFYPVNVEGTRNVLEIMRIHDIPSLIYTSSTALYGFPNKKEPLTEDAPINPTNNYQRSKTDAENLIWEYAMDYGIRTTAVRAPTVIGKGDLFTGPQLIERIRIGKMVTFSGGTNIQTYTHGEDFARCLILAAENIQASAGKAYNAVSFTCQFKEFLDTLADELGVPKRYQNFPYGPTLALGAIAAGIYRAFHRRNAPLITPFRVRLFGSNYIIDGSRAKEELGFEPRWDLQSTVKDMVKWGGYVKAR
ncbi:MAG: NAD-dependent epimerase/dehydratase family protein [Candidatus Hodarchaeota archaeon]